MKVIDLILLTVTVLVIGWLMLKKKEDFTMGCDREDRENTEENKEYRDYNYIDNSELSQIETTEITELPELPEINEDLYSRTILL